MKGVMSFALRCLAAGAFVLVLVRPAGLNAQGNPDPFEFKFNNGQGLQPIFEGWSKNPDGTFQMWYGYYNRNFLETLLVPVGADNVVGLPAGPDNKVALTQPDRGQPTVFLPRIHRKAFSVAVPADFGKKQLIWIVTVRGETEKAIGWLQPVWEIDPIYGGKSRNAESLKNKPPVLTLNLPSSTVSLPNTLTLAATVVDDGLPTPRKGPPSRAIGQETPPSLKPLPDQAEIPVNVPGLGGGRGAGAGGQGPQGLTLRWIEWRGPAVVTFDHATTQVKDKDVVVMATFTKPGTYVLRATADDGELHVDKDVTVTVN
jgi:hypothetical protein